MMKTQIGFPEAEVVGKKRVTRRQRFLAEIHQTMKGNEWHFPMKAHAGFNADMGPIHCVVGTAANVSDVSQAH